VTEPSAYNRPLGPWRPFRPPVYDCPMCGGRIFEGTLWCCPEEDVVHVAGRGIVHRACEAQIIPDRWFAL
jgi:hypothetical protein